MMCHLFYTSPFWVNSLIRALKIQWSCDNFSWVTRGEGGSWEGWDGTMSRPYVRLSWLWDIYEDCCAHKAWECAVRAYLLHLVGCTIFVDKSVTFISISYLLLFNNLRMCGGYTRGAVTLIHLYEQLRNACYFNTKQLGNYATLVQVSNHMLHSIILY